MDEDTFCAIMYTNGNEPFSTGESWLEGESANRNGANSLGTGNVLSFAGWTDWLFNKRNDLMSIAGAELVSAAKYIGKIVRKIKIENENVMVRGELSETITDPELLLFVGGLS